MVIELALEDPQVLVEDAERDDGETRPEEGGASADVPAAEDDAGVDDLGVPDVILHEFSTVRGQLLSTAKLHHLRLHVDNGQSGLTRACAYCTLASRTYACRVLRGRGSS